MNSLCDIFSSLLPWRLVFLPCVGKLVGYLVVVDRVEREGTAVASRWPIAPGWRLEPVTGGLLASFEEQDLRVRVELPEELDWAVERAPFYRTFHHEQERDVLVGRGTGPLKVALRFVRVG